MFVSCYNMATLFLKNLFIKLIRFLNYNELTYLKLQLLGLPVLTYCGLVEKILRDEAIKNAKR